MSRSENLFMARLSEQAERFDDMVEYMKRVASMGTELTSEERNLLSVAFKNCLTTRRQAWRVMKMDEQRMPQHADWIRGYRATLEEELDTKCKEMLATLDTQLIPKASDNEAKVFFMKMKGDYHRYHAEFQSSPGKDASASEASAAYQAALQQASDTLSPAHPLRLGLALNFSVFYNEVLGQALEAVNLARATCEAAKADLPSLDPESQNDAAQIIQLLNENLNLWTQSAAGDAPALDGTAVEDL